MINLQQLEERGTKIPKHIKQRQKEECTKLIQEIDNDIDICLKEAE